MIISAKFYKSFETDSSFSCAGQYARADKVIIIDADINVASDCSKPTGFRGTVISDPFRGAKFDFSPPGYYFQEIKAHKDLEVFI